MHAERKVSYPHPSWVDESDLTGCWSVLRYLYDLGESVVTCARERDGILQDALDVGARLAHVDEGMVVALGDAEPHVLCRYGEGALDKDERVRLVVEQWESRETPIDTVIYNPDGVVGETPEFEALLVAPLRVRCRPRGYLALKKRGVFTSGERGIFTTVCACISPLVAEEGVPAPA
jgi:hypothetical protein